LFGVGLGYFNPNYAATNCGWANNRGLKTSGPEQDPSGSYPDITAQSNAVRFEQCVVS
jgi:hypothetical protein